MNEQPKNALKSVRSRINEISLKLSLKKDRSVRYKEVRFEYITGESIVGQLKPLLVEYDLFLKFNVGKVSDSVEYEGVLTICDVNDVNQYETYTMQSPGVLMNNNALQGAGALRTYMKRYLLLDAFHIVDAKNDIEGLLFDSKHGFVDSSTVQRPDSATVTKLANDLNMAKLRIRDLFDTGCVSSSDFEEFVGVDLYDISVEHLPKARQFYLINNPNNKKKGVVENE